MEYIWIVVIAIVLQILWLWTLLAHLSSEECSSTDKICWTIVLCVLNVVGMVLFLIGGPKGKDEVLSEEALKRSFNQGQR